MNNNSFIPYSLGVLGMLPIHTGEISRSISPENPTGGKGMGAMCEPENGVANRACRDLGRGWKVNPYICLQPGETRTIADIAGPGCIKHIWMTPTGNWRDVILSIYWDNQDFPSVECPVGDFFCCGWGEYAQLSSLAVCVNPGSAFNCYWPMPFASHCKITLRNRSENVLTYYYQIDYTLGEIARGSCYFHAMFRRVNPLPYGEIVTIAENIKGKGQYVGTYLAWGVNNSGWWGEGELKFYMDGDTEFPTICTTGTEDYFCGSYDFENPKTHNEYLAFNTPYAGLHQVLEPDRLYRSQFRFGLYRWHIQDPVYFDTDLRVTIQALGWRNGAIDDRRYLPLQDDISSVVYWYQTIPHQPFSPLQSRDYLEVI